MPEPAALLPPLAIAAFLMAIAAAAALTNCAILTAFLKHSTNGIFSFIIQLVVADILLGVTLASELWSWNARTWTFGITGCTLFQGLNVLSTTASLYLVMSIALHSLATNNIEEKSVERRMKRADQDDEELRSSSRHSLVANSDSSTPPRTMNVDYRLANTKVPTILPTVFVWILAASLSVPEFVFSKTVPQGKGTLLCALDSSHTVAIHTLLAVFTVFLPIFIMSTAAALIIVKLKAKKRLHYVDNYDNITAGLKLSLRLIIVYVILCAPRSILRGYSVYSASVNKTETFVMVESMYWSYIKLSLSSVCLMTVLARPIIYIVTVPEVRKAFCFKTKEGRQVSNV